MNTKLFQPAKPPTLDWPKQLSLSSLAVPLYTLVAGHPLDAFEINKRETGTDWVGKIFLKFLDFPNSLYDIPSTNPFSIILSLSLFSFSLSTNNTLQSPNPQSP